MNRWFEMVIAATALGFAVTTLQAGDLTPPAGPVAPTMKKLSDVEPRMAVNSTNTPGDATSILKIQQRGSYYLTANVNGVAGKDGISINSDGVTLDLNGFDVVGVAGSGIGITVANFQHCTIRNGGVRSWGSYGINSQSSATHVENVSAVQNGSTGIFVGVDGHVVNCTIRLNGNHGMTAGSNSVIERCVATFNGATTLHNGINASDRCLVRDCVANNNTGVGIRVNHGGRVVDCAASLNDAGISTFTTGFITGANCHLNTHDGINAGNGTTVRNCACEDNGDDGIQVASECAVIGNSCSNNGPAAAGAGIYVVGDACRIEDNHLTFNRYGILVPAASTENFIVRNTARNNGSANFSISAGNDAAPIITNPGSTFTGATPWSNFAF